jgi:hypothetical protein
MMKKLFYMKGLIALTAVLALAPAVAAESKAKAELKVVAVAAAFEAPAEHAGRVGLEGTVVELETSEPAFVIVTPNPPGSCPSECCAPKRLTIRVPKATFKGKLPKVNDKLVVVGELKPLTVGFEFKPQEVQKGGKVLLSKAKK